jgi:hypothetical protein
MALRFDGAKLRELQLFRNKLFIRTVLLLLFIFFKQLIYFIGLFYNNLFILIIIILVFEIIESLILKGICGILIVVYIKCFLDEAFCLWLNKEGLQNVSIYYIV